MDQEAVGLRVDAVADCLSTVGGPSSREHVPSEGPAGMSDPGDGGHPYVRIRGEETADMPHAAGVKRVWHIGHSARGNIRDIPFAARI